MSKSVEEYCSFCGREAKEVQILVTGLDGFICEQCVQSAMDIVSLELNVKPSSKLTKKPSGLTIQKPKEIVQFLDDWIIGYRNGVGFENSGLAELGREIQCGSGCPQINRRISQGKTFNGAYFQEFSGFSQSVAFFHKAILEFDAGTNRAPHT